VAAVCFCTSAVFLKWQYFEDIMITFLKIVK
jgi:hypothetical protein